MNRKNFKRGAEAHTAIAILDSAAVMLENNNVRLNAKDQMSLQSIINKLYHLRNKQMKYFDRANSECNE